MTGRGQANALTRATAILATLFFITSLGLTVLASYSRGPKSILDRAVTQQQKPGTPAPTGTPLDQLKQLEQQRSTAVPAAPALPEAPRSQ